jgi:plastocyanin
MSHISSRRARRAGGGSGNATRFALTRRYFASGITLAALLTLGAIAAAPAAELTASIIDPAGHAVGDVVITAVSAPVPAPAALVTQATQPAQGSAVMDQRNLEFVPRILVVATGTSVEFPNNDSVSHQVYSFSQAKRFQLPLYKGERHPPVIFEREGLVVLGCNIHDQMVGYIYVTKAPFFGKTDTSGTLRLQNLPAGDYLITIWSPLIADPPPTLVRTVHVDASETAPERFQLTRPLRARPEPRPRRGDWEY